MKIGIIGCGVVGTAVSDGLERLGHRIFRHDPYKYNTTVQELMDFSPEVCFICVPTPQNDDGQCDVSIVESVVDELTSKRYLGVIAIKSTIEPGTMQKLYNRYSSRYDFPRYMRLAFVPEFLREKSAFHDFTEGHDTCIIGTRYGDVSDSSCSVFRTLSHAHGRYPKRIIHMPWKDAELVKYFSNVFNALRVTFANGFFDVCEKLGADYTAIKNAVATRGTFTDMYLDCNANFRGYAGPCLPKDTAAFAHLTEALGVDAKIFRTIVEDNALYEPKVPVGMREK